VTIFLFAQKISILALNAIYYLSRNMNKQMNVQDKQRYIYVY